MLILTRRPRQLIRIAPHPSLDPSTPIGELFRNGPIVIAITDMHRQQVKIGIQADSRLLILREELCDDASPSPLPLCAES